MISSKKITVTAILLIAAAFTLTLFLMLRGARGTEAGGAPAWFGDDDIYSDYRSGEYDTIELLGDTAVSDSSNVSVTGSDVTILGGGVYVLSGELEGSVIVNAEGGAEVRLVLGGVNIVSPDYAAIYVEEAAKTVISLEPGTENHLTDGSVYSEEKLEDGKPSAALYSRDDLTVNGEGSLTVTGNYLDGIKVNDTLRITGGTIHVTAVDEGINVNDMIAVKNASIEINAGGDGLKCDSSDGGKGNISVRDTVLTAVSGGDGISASGKLYAEGLTANVTAGGGASAAEPKQGGERPEGFDAEDTEGSVSTKAIKAAGMELTGGSYTLDSADDALHSDADMTVSGGSFVITTGDDGVHADMTVTLEPDTMDISVCYEGIEGAYITINGGDISIVSNDDGLNATGEDTASGFGGRLGAGGETKIAEEDIYLTINGGNLYIETSGDGIDSNGSAVINGGSIEVCGPENSGNGSIDVGDGGYVLAINGGSLIAAGASGMAEYPYSGSAQRSLVFYLEETCAAGSVIRVTDSAGGEVLSGTSNKSFGFVCVSSEKITEGETYTLYINGTETASLTSSETVSLYGMASGGRGMGGRGMGGALDAAPDAQPGSGSDVQTSAQPDAQSEAVDGMQEGAQGGMQPGGRRAPEDGESAQPPEGGRGGAGRSMNQ